MAIDHVANFSWDFGVDTLTKGPAGGSCEVLEGFLGLGIVVGRGLAERFSFAAYGSQLRFTGIQAHTHGDLLFDSSGPK